MKPEMYMLRGLELASKGAGRVAPNPMVGSVLVYQNRIIGEGWHACYGGPHAEVNCLRSVAASDRKYIRKSCLYVTLEPCVHFGQTPPCTDLIIDEQIPEVVIGCRDSFSLVAGKGVDRLSAAGIRVHTGVLEAACRRLNKRFLCRQENGRPYVILKWAESADRFMAPVTGKKTQLSGAVAQRWVHRMRHEEDAVMVGFQTAVTDNPQLTNRHWVGTQPIRVVIDPENELPRSLHLFDQKCATYIINYHHQFSEQNTHWIQVARGRELAAEVLRALPKINSLIIEGGSKTLQRFLDAGLWDEAFLIHTPVTLGGGIPSPTIRHAGSQESFALGADVVSLYIHERNRFYF